MGVEPPKNRGILGTPKWMVENKGKPWKTLLNMGWFGGKLSPYFWVDTHIGFAHKSCSALEPSEGRKTSGTPQRLIGLMPSEEPKNHISNLNLAASKGAYWRTMQTCKHVNMPHVLKHIYVYKKSMQYVCKQSAYAFSNWWLQVMNL